MSPTAASQREVDDMAATALLMIALLLSTLASGVAFSHILEIPGKRRSSRGVRLTMS
jgi:hypothetical protein